MKKIETITITKQQSYSLALQSVLMLFIGAMIFVGITGKSTGNGSIWAFIAYCVTIILHELLHGLGFVMAGARPAFGFAMAGIMPAAYATSKDKVSVRRMLVVAYLPFIVLSIVTVAGALLWPKYADIMMVCFLGNFAGAIGDIWIASKLWKYLPYRDVMIVDTKVGTEVYSGSSEAAKIGAKSANKIEKNSSFAKVWVISSMAVLAMQLMATSVMIWIGFEGNFRLGTEWLSLVDVRTSEVHTAATLNLLSPILIGGIISLIYSAFEHSGRIRRGAEKASIH